jgi:diguanylate cyclase (GGDEF)-like protein/PAS domain S-box-containing protein
MTETSAAAREPANEAAQLRLRQRRFTALAFATALGLCAAFGALAWNARALHEKNTAESIAANQSALLQARLNRSLSATYALAAVLRQGDGKIAHFDQLAAEMIELLGGISSLQLAKDGVVSDVVPLVGNERILGHDLLHDPRRDQAARLAIDSRQMTLAGPLELIQGGMAVIGRLPVFLSDATGTKRFWGLTTAVIRVPDLLAASRLASLGTDGYAYQLSWVHPASGKRVIFAGSTMAPLTAPVTRTIAVPNGAWLLSIAPRDGWVPITLSIAIAAAMLLGSLLVACFTYTVLRQPVRLQRDVAARTAALASINRDLEREIDERTLAQAAAAQLTRLYSVLSHTNGIIIRVTERAQLFHDICEVAVQHGGFPLATIALAGEADGAWQVVARSGAARDPVACAALPDCARCGGVAAERPTASTCLAALAAGFASSVSFQLKQDNVVIGLFSLYAYEAYFFDAAQLRLLTEMANDVSFVLGNLAHEALRREAEERLRKLSRAVEQSANAVVITDRRGIIEYVNPWFTKITGYTMADVVGKNPRILKSAETHPETYRRLWDTLLSGKEWLGELHNTKKNGELYWCLEAISPLKNEAGEVTHFVAITEDISERKQSEQTIHHLAFHDALTGLPNRRLFRDRLLHALASAERKHDGFALMLLDLDHFKKINDTLGHDAGDELLVIVAKRLGAVLRKVDTLARMGGDEFALIAVDVAEPKDAAHIAEALQQALRAPVQLQGRELFLSTSVGITIYPNDADDVDSLVKNADIALYRAKDLGRDNFQFFTPQMNAALVQRQQMENSMRFALERGQFLLMYQPQVNLADGTMHCVEALIRWHHPEQGMIAPADFIPLAEETGMILAIGDWVLRTACAQARAWQLAGMPMRVAVNLSARQFKQGDIANQVENILRETGLDSQFLEIEMTEGMLLEDTAQTSATLDTLHRMGLQISIDDFGTGYSSLSYLKRLPLDILKIDQSFVRDIHTDADDRSIVTAVIALAHSLHLSVVAEGVETPEQLAFLRALGCDTIQGFLFSRPVPPDEVLALFRAGRRLEH